MVSFKCKICGAFNQVQNDAKFGRCEYCGISSALSNETHQAEEVHQTIVKRVPIDTTMESCIEYARELVGGMRRQSGRLQPCSDDVKFRKNIDRLLASEIALLRDEYPIVLWDDTFFRGNKNGFLITSSSIYYHEILSSVERIDFRAITNITFNKQIIVQTSADKHSISVTMCDAAFRDSLSDMVMRVYNDFTILKRS